MIIKGLSGVMCSALLIMLIGVALVSCTAAPVETPHIQQTNSTEVKPLQATPSGAQLYAANCAGCHGSSPPSSWRTRTNAQLTNSINTGLGSMPAYSGVLISTEIAALVQYILGAPTTTTMPPAGGVNSTECASCHGNPITANCLSCHPSLPTRVINRNFPHHRTQAGGEAPNNCRLNGCHDGTANDVRLVQAPIASTAYCDDCHEDDD